MKRIFIWVLFICMTASAIGYILYRYHRGRLENQKYNAPVNINPIEIILTGDVQIKLRQNF